MKLYVISPRTRTGIAVYEVDAEVVRGRYRVYFEPGKARKILGPGIAATKGGSYYTYKFEDHHYADCFETLPDALRRFVSLGAFWLPKATLSRQLQLKAVEQAKQMLIEMGEPITKEKIDIALTLTPEQIKNSIEEKER